MDYFKDVYLSRQSTALVHMTGLLATKRKYRVGQIKWGQITFLLVTSKHKIKWLWQSNKWHDANFILMKA